jgi:outer membrane lipoprotein SlyB
MQTSSIWGGIITGGLSQLQDIIAFRKGEMAKQEFAVQTTQNVTGAVGVMAGLEYGAVLGSMVMPGVGTIVGSMAGAILGDRLGRTLGQKTAASYFHSRNTEDEEAAQQLQVH